MQANTRNTKEPSHYDSVIIGAGFGGIRASYEMRKQGLTTKLFEAGSDVGGTWYWNRYPGARTDTESWGYCFFFSQELNEEWDWQERMPTWDQVQNYMVYAVDRLDLRKDMQFNTRVQSAHYDEASNLWTVTTDQGDVVTCQYLITAVGWFEEPCKPDFKGIDSFKGPWYLPSRWPKDDIDFAGKKVGIIGSGSTAVQILTALAHTAEHVTMFQRTPNYVMPGRNYPVDAFEKQYKKKNFQEIIDQTRKQVYAFPMIDSTIMYDDIDEAERQRVLEAGWEAGGFRYIFQTFADITVNPRANEAACEFFRNKIRSIVKNPELAELLCPNYPIALKRPPVCNFYYENFNRPNVSLVDVSKTAIDEITPNGVKVGDTEYEFDILVFAMGYDAVTGPLMNLDVRGRNGQTIKQKWADGPHTQLGIVMDEFPNLFMITGPQTPFSNVPPVVESSCTWIGKLLTQMKSQGFNRVEASPQAVADWTKLMKVLIDQTLMKDAASQRAWFMGANIPGKPHAVLFYFGGAGPYFELVDKEAEAGFPSLVFSSSASTSQKRA